MTRITLLVTILIMSVSGYAQVSFSSKDEAMDFAKKCHNGAIIRIQKYIQSTSEDDISAAFILSSKASSIVQLYCTLISDVLAYGSDAVRIV